jgi:Fic-DOC domain mobile mystery protein B
MMPKFKPIPGETPITDVSELKDRSIKNRGQLNKAEARNIAKTMAQYLGGPITPKEAPFDFSWFCQLHREMFEDVWGWAGRLRKSVTNIGIAPHLIEVQLYDLSKNLPYWANETLLMQATMLHHQAVQIHPFENGNGRWSRTLANIWLHLHAHELTQWPGAALSEESEVRAEYLAAIKAADDHDYQPLLALHQRFTSAKSSQNK